MIEQDAMPKRPWIATTAYYMLWLWVLSILGFPAIEFVSGRRWLEGGNSESEALIAAILLSLALFGFPLAAVVCDVGRGHNWARIIFLIVLLLHTPSQLLSIIQDPGDSAFPLGPLYRMYHLEILLVAVVLLFQRSSSDWFKAVKKLRSKDESPD